MVMPRAVTSIVDCGKHQGDGAEACVTTAITTLRAVTARTVREASSEIPVVQKLRLTPANVRPYMQFYFKTECSLFIKP